MCARERLPAGVRKKIIRDAAKNVFLKKGFSATTMEDIIAEVGMSKGGVYRHYGSTSEMLYDLMVDGNQNRYDIIDDYLCHNKEQNIEDLMVEMALMKMLDQSEYKSLYAMFLVEAEKNSKLKELRDEMIANSKMDYLDFIKKRNLHNFSCLIQDEWIAFINSIIVANELLDVKSVFLEHKDFLRVIIRTFITASKDKKK